ncbi:hypothetical protein [Sphingobium algorifonticola]|uniref:Uncharacterized protein n=1 Tax=Sphingobium algorifonticola TaxID=2008318 RepID=A0A437J6M5_9SPHN|nr:hypothetical protein [Sphingobium algorifonticola]RVT40800.1 hypothetical protein ENE74_09990 [Sphingobium algorifonticola]
MTKPRAKKIGLFAVLSIVYWLIAMFLILLAGIGSCGMGPEAPADCNGIWPAITGFLSLVIFTGLTVAFFKARLSGVDK